MSRQFYFKQTKTLFYSIIVIILVAFIGESIFFFSTDSVWQICLLDVLIGYPIMVLIIIMFFRYDAKKLLKEFQRLHNEFRYDELENFLLKIDSFYQPPLYKGFYHPRKVMLKGLIINVLILKNKIEEAEIIHREIISHLNRKSKNNLGELFFRVLFIMIQIEKKDISLIEEEIPVFKERINLLKFKMQREQYNKSLYYLQIILSYMKEEYDDLDQKIIPIINQETGTANIVGKRYTLGKIYMKQGKDKQAIEQFEFVLNENKNFIKYQEAEEYYQQLLR